jgi:hypothetical protein
MVRTLHPTLSYENLHLPLGNLHPPYEVHHRVHLRPSPAGPRRSPFGAARTVHDGANCVEKFPLSILPRVRAMMHTPCGGNCDTLKRCFRGYFEGAHPTFEGAHSTWYGGET